MAFIYISVVLIDHPGIQIIALNLCNLFMEIYIGGIRPLETRKQNRFEIFNEFTITLCTYMFMCFTEWIPKEETKYMIGWYLIILLLFNIIVNMGMVFKTVLSKLSLVC